MASKLLYEYDRSAVVQVDGTLLLSGVRVCKCRRKFFASPRNCGIERRGLRDN
jgi:hypothetical protein